MTMTVKAVKTVKVKVAWKYLTMLPPTEVFWPYVQRDVDRFQVNGHITTHREWTIFADELRAVAVHDACPE